MNIETIAATILFSLGGLYYCYLILDGSVHPAFATWLIFFIAVAISFSSYLLKKGLSGWWINIQNATDVFFVTLALILIIRQSGWKIFPLNLYDKACLVLTAGIVLFWLAKRDHFRTNVATQLLLVIGYFPTLEKIWFQANQESYFLWGSYWLASLIALIPAVNARDWLAALYSTRAFVMISIVLLSMIVM